MPNSLLKEVLMEVFYCKIIVLRSIYQNNTHRFIHRNATPRKLASAPINKALFLLFLKSFSFSIEGAYGYFQNAGCGTSAQATTMKTLRTSQKRIAKNS